MTRRAAYYARVSTAHQEQDQTIDAQIAALEQAAAAVGLVVPTERRYVDNGLSGSRLDRPALDALRDAAAEGLVDIVLIHSPDRLARNFVHQQVIVEELSKRDVEVHFVDRPIGERPEDRLLLQMQGVIAEYERAKIIERMRRGMRHKVRTGQTLPVSKPPYGYAILRSAENPRGVLVVDEVEAEYVRAMYRWVRDEELSVRRVAQRLNELGVRPRQRPFWVLASVYRILTNSVYAGTAVYGKRESVEPKRPRKPGAYRSSPRSSVRMRTSAHWIEVPSTRVLAAHARRVWPVQLAHVRPLPNQS
jgi:site-specific DNA recombinase